MSGSAPALAQETAAEASEGQAIVITGSRIVRRDYTATSPIVTVDTDLIEKSSSINLEANLNKLPQFAPAITQFGPPEGRGDINSTATNTPGATTVSLRQLGSNRNLVLIDGRRPTPINGTGVVDINSIPSGGDRARRDHHGRRVLDLWRRRRGRRRQLHPQEEFPGPDRRWPDGHHPAWRRRRIPRLGPDGRQHRRRPGQCHRRRRALRPQGSLQFDRKAYVDLYSSPDTLGNTIFGFEQTYFLFQTLTGQAPGSGNPSQAALKHAVPVQGRAGHAAERRGAQHHRRVRHLSQ